MSIDDRQKQGIKQEFNRVVRHPDKFNGEPYIANKDVKVKDLIKLFSKGADNALIYKTYPSLDKKDIDSARAWQVRFRPKTLKSTHNLDPNNKFFLMDENTSFYILFNVAKIFGYSSHVKGEGLHGIGHNDDEKHIWLHAIKKGYKAILTADSDFIDIATRHRRLILENYNSVNKSPLHTPAVIRIENNLSRNECLKLLDKHQDEIKAFVDDNNYRYAFLDRSGFTPKIHDRTVKRAIKKSQQNQAPKP
jgi:uncharacterized protein (DUF433 family)